MWLCLESNLNHWLYIKFASKMGWWHWNLKVWSMNFFYVGDEGIIIYLSFSIFFWGAIFGHMCDSLKKSINFGYWFGNLRKTYRRHKSDEGDDSIKLCLYSENLTNGIEMKRSSYYLLVEVLNEVIPLHCIPNIIILNCYYNYY